MFVKSRRVRERGGQPALVQTPLAQTPAADAERSIEAPPSVSDWPDSAALPKRDWLIEDWLPAGRFGILTGAGGVGKSRLALQLAAAVAAGQGNWLPPNVGGDVMRPCQGDGKAVIASWEDELDKLQRRVASLRDGCTWARPDALRGRLIAYDMRKHGQLWTQDGGRDATAEPLKTACSAAKLLVIDNAAAFGGNENERAAVRAFCCHWDAWASSTGCAVMLITHPPKNESRYFGSTDWRNAARFLWALEWEPVQPGSKDRAPQLTLDKSNYGRCGSPSVWLRSLSCGAGWEQCAALAAHAALGKDETRKISDDLRAATDVLEVWRLLASRALDRDPHASKLPADMAAIGAWLESDQFDPRREQTRAAIGTAFARAYGVEDRPTGWMVRYQVRDCDSDSVRPSCWSGKNSSAGTRSGASAEGSTRLWRWCANGWKGCAKQSPSMCSGGPPCRTALRDRRAGGRPGPQRDGGGLEAAAAGGQRGDPSRGPPGILNMEGVASMLEAIRIAAAGLSLSTVTESNPSQLKFEFAYWTSVRVRQAFSTASVSASACGQSAGPCDA